MVKPLRVMLSVKYYADCTKSAQIFIFDRNGTF